jgi:hypothetical protein
MASAQSWLNQNFAMLNHRVLGFKSGAWQKTSFRLCNATREDTRVVIGEDVGEVGDDCGNSDRVAGRE